MGKGSLGEVLVKGTKLGTVFAGIIIIFLGAGYFLGTQISKIGAVIGMIVGATAGLVVVTWLGKKVSERYREKGKFDIKFKNKEEKRR